MTADPNRDHLFGYSVVGENEVLGCLSGAIRRLKFISLMLCAGDQTHEMFAAAPDSLEGAGAAVADAAELIQRALKALEPKGGAR